MPPLPLTIVLLDGDVVATVEIPFPLSLVSYENMKPFNEQGEPNTTLNTTFSVRHYSE